MWSHKLETQEPLRIFPLSAHFTFNSAVNLSVPFSEVSKPSTCHHLAEPSPA